MGQVATRLLHVDRLGKTYPGQVALADAQLIVRAGEVHALVGQNGSGKSTLIKLLGGYVKADHGARVAFDGRPVDLWSLEPDVRRRIRIVHQDLGLVPTLSTIENLGLGRGWQSSFGRIAWQAEAARAQDDLLRFGLAPDVRQPVATLSAAERAAVAIVRALRDWRPDERGLLVLDEPTASLNRLEVDALFREVRRVTGEGNGVLFVSHILDEVLELADRVTVLRDGRVVAAGLEARSLTPDALVELIVGQRVGGASQRPARVDDSRRPVLEADGLVGTTLRGVSLTVHEGEVLGVAGLVGSGRDELASALFGATPRYAGRVMVDKRKVFTAPRESIAAGMALVPADRKVLGLVAQDRLVDHVPLPRYAPLLRHGRLRHRVARADVASWADRLDVQPRALGRRMEKFSGGNQQKAVLARWLRTEPTVLLLDEPTQGVDVGAKAGIYRTIESVADAGTAVLVTSSDAEELVRTCDRVLVLRGGMLAAELIGPTLTEERIVAEMLGSLSSRKATRLGRRTAGPLVIRGDADAPTSPTIETAAASTAETDDTDDDVGSALLSRSGRLLLWVRRALERVRV